VDLPSGMVTLLFTDIEGSTRHWEQHPDQMGIALSAHDAALRLAIESNCGYVFKTVGDAFCAAFASPEDAVSAAVAGQLSLASISDVLPLKVRMAIHCGEPVLRDRDYFGPAVNRVARILDAAHGGQVLISASVAASILEQCEISFTLIDHGAHLLKDLSTPEVLFQVVPPGLSSEFPPLKTLSTHPNNLPTQLTSFVGRNRELAGVMDLLNEGVRLITLSGAGGSGKTRIALEVAADRVERYPGGVWWIDLSRITDPNLVMPAVGDVLGVEERSELAIEAQVAAKLSSGASLLVLDNFEQVMGAAESIDDLLHTCPQLSILVTSRHVLNLSGEHEYSIPGLDIEEAKALFIARAQQADSLFKLCVESQPAVERICRRLDGLPLAIELAAAQVRMLSPAGIDNQLSQRFRILVSPHRDVSNRQRTLRATIDWSYNLLPIEERGLLAALSAFSGGFTLESAQAVTNRDDVYFGLGRLRDHSLLMVDSQGSDLRFRLLETIREYGKEMLRDSGRADEVFESHAGYFQQLAKDVSISQELRTRSLTQEMENIQTALGWLFGSGNWARAAEMCVSLARHWERTGRFREAAEALERCLESPVQIEPGLLLAVLREAGWFAFLQGRLEDSAQRLNRCLGICRSIGQKQEEANALNNLAITVHAQGRLDEARRLQEESLRLARHIGDESKLGPRLSNLALLEIEEGQFDFARKHLEEATNMYKAQGDSGGIAACLCNLAELALKNRDWAEAERLSRQSHEIFTQVGDKRGVAFALVNMSQSQAHLGDYGASQSNVAEALVICRDAELWTLSAQLLELCVRNFVRIGKPESAASCRAASERMWELTKTTRSPGDEQELADMIPLTEAVALVHQTVWNSKEEIVNEILNEISV